jgi:hypothetical protein
MKRHVPIVVACTLGLVACGPDTDSGSPSGGREESAPELTGGPSATATEYSTAVSFLPYEAASTRALILDFANYTTSGRLSQRYLGWQLRGQGGWRTILDVVSESGAVREPWRLMPADSLRLTVNADGDPNALVLRSGAADNTLDLGDPLDRWEDRAGTQHEIREAAWSSRGQRVEGIVVQHRFAIPEPEQPARFGPYERAILRSEDGAIIVLFHSREPDLYGDSYAWMYADGLTRRWTALETRTVEVANSAQLRRNVPIRIWFRIPEPDIKGELTAAERQFNELEVDQGPMPYNALYRVRGWIEFAGERRSVEGLLERGEP